MSFYQLIDTKFFSISTKQQTDESKLQAAKRRAERETADYKQRVLGFVFFFNSIRLVCIDISGSLEKELERLHSKLERPASSMERTFPTASDPSRK
jgi:hypothetical protein